ncbi:Hsp20/alpha crystallin family protein [Pleomorphovibrio marinus]|uniref:Hsp20/alpha crystallin family protein n=1 Tax=Pleomorphovibrio marinus TaxID=2164132 RepID=UPI000E0C2186|nr:Hsp20/alpha crystallin family protein [Pleomorphovibrio marinus]
MENVAVRNEMKPLQKFFDDFLTRELFHNNWNNASRVPMVNILETDDAFEIEMAVPGMRKEDFTISLDNQVLNISAHLEEKVANEGNNEQYLRREFSYYAFQRTFNLPEFVEADKIKAKYENGLLRLYVPKKEEAKKKPAKAIHIQ